MKEEEGEDEEDDDEKEDGDENDLVCPSLVSIGISESPVSFLSRSVIELIFLLDTLVAAVVVLVVAAGETAVDGLFFWLEAF